MPFLNPLDVTKRIERLDRNAASLDTGQPHITNASVAHVTTTSASVNTALNALGTKINAILEGLEDAGVFLTS